MTFLSCKYISGKLNGKKWNMQTIENMTKTAAKREESNGKYDTHFCRCLSWFNFCDMQLEKQTKKNTNHVQIEPATIKVYKFLPNIISIIEAQLSDK